MADEYELRTKVRALQQAFLYRPVLTTAILVVSVVAALLEGIGISFLLPIVEQIQNSGSAESAGGVVGVFVAAYDMLDIPFTLEYIVVGVSLVMVARFTASFLVEWLRAHLRTGYIQHAQSEAFSNTLDAEVSYFDERGSDEILNVIITETKYCGQVIEHVVAVIEQGLVSLIYVSIVLYLAPRLTLFAAALLGGAVLLVRYGFEAGATIGSRVADANERVQQNVQAGTQGVRDVKLFTLTEELYRKFESSVDHFVRSEVKLKRNQAAMQNFYQLLIAVTIFALIYVAVRVSSLSLANLSVFLFAMFRLGPRVSTLNDFLYRIDGNLPHLVRTQKFIGELEKREEAPDSTADVDEPIDIIAFNDVRFAYDNEEVLSGVSFEFDRQEYVAFVGPSGAGKSTIVGLLTRMYRPQKGTIMADGHPIDDLDLEAWRKRIAVVRQHPYLFDDTLRYNLSVGNRDASDEEIREVCDIAQVTEFLEGLPQGLETPLGDDGVRLSGGQRQRIAIARALLKDADFIVFDEATSDLDTNLEQRVHGGIETMDRDRGLFVIAHRLSTVTGADRIYAMENGRIVERGSHEELLDTRGMYSKLYSRQAES
jgi:subfamily B ATP-binding cassette protein MsbA